VVLNVHSGLRDRHSARQVTEDWKWN
jgi:hypothetical protein